jgi:hypothetical protein
MLLMRPSRLIAHCAGIEWRCSEFGATPLFWAVHGHGPDGPKEKKDQVGAALALIAAGASVQTSNKHGLSALDLSGRSSREDMHQALQQSGKSVPGHATPTADHPAGPRPPGEADG